MCGRWTNCSVFTYRPSISGDDDSVFPRYRDTTRLPSRGVNSPQGRGICGGLSPQDATSSGQALLVRAANVAVRAHAHGLASVDRPSRRLTMATVTTLWRGNITLQYVIQHS